MKENQLPYLFTIRVYGLLIHNQAVLLSQENIRGEIYTKFPGGGLEFGEGTLACLKREFMEEVHINIEPTQHFYTTEDFVQSAFGEEYQVMSIYYRVQSNEINKIKTGQPGDWGKLQEHGDQILFWQSIDKLSPPLFELPIDRKVVELLKSETRP